MKATRWNITEEKDKMNISKHISYKEGVRSNTAIRRGIDNTFKRVSNADMYYWIKNNLNFDQMIWEFGDDNNPNWVHISYVSAKKNRNRCLKAYKENGKTKYKQI